MNIALFGGKFNPPTIGHVETAKSVLALDSVDEVWFMPKSYKSLGGGGRYSKIIDEHRIAMLNLVVGSNSNIKIFDYEIRKSRYLNGTTYKTMNHIDDDPDYDHTFSIVIGTDQANSMRRWTNSVHLREAYPFIVVNRGYAPCGDEWFMRSPHMFVNAEVIISASTDVRSSIVETRGHETAKAMLDKEVYKYIIKNKLYI